MRMDHKSYNDMNTLAAMCFNANAIIDNLAYSLDYHYYNNIAKIIHLNVAHVMPEWSDIITDKMLQLSARPVRLNINGYEQDFSELKDVFTTLKQTFEDIYSFTQGLIERADMSGDDEVRIFGEEFLLIVSPFLKQSEEWLNIVDKMDPAQLDLHFDHFTHFIKIG